MVTGVQFDLLAEEEREEYELVDGGLVEVSSATPIHNRLIAVLTAQLESFLSRERRGFVLPETDFDFGAEQRFRPDLVVFRPDPWSRVDADKLPVTIAPEIVVEIVSPSDPADKLERKIAVYLERGVGEVWVVYSGTRHVWVHTAADVRLLRESDSLSTPVVPGWSLSVAGLFAAAR